MKTKITKAIVWIMYVLFVGVLIYGAILRTNAVSAERGLGGNEGRFGSGDGRGYYDREIPQLPDERGYVPFNGDHQPRRGQGDGWMHEPDHRFGLPFGEDRQYDGQPRDGRGSGRWFNPLAGEELNDYAERYLDIDDLLEKAGEK